MQTLLIWHTDIWQTTSSYRLVGVASSKTKAFKLLQEDEDAISDVNSNDGIIIIERIKINIKDSGEEIFNTTSSADRQEILNKK